jgi:hypothetical protein
VITAAWFSGNLSCSIELLLFLFASLLRGAFQTSSARGGYDQVHVLTMLQALLPLLTAVISENELLSKHFALPTTNLDGSAAETKTSGAQPQSYGMLAVLTASASAGLAIYAVSTTLALGLSSAIFTATGLVIFESAIQAATSGAQPQRFAALRDVAAAIAVICGVAALLMEPSLTASSISWEPVYREYSREWRDVHNFRTLQRFLWMIPVHAVLNILTFLMVRTTIFRRRHVRCRVSP